MYLWCVWSVSLFFVLTQLGGDPPGTDTDSREGGGFPFGPLPAVSVLLWCFQLPARLSAVCLIVARIMYRLCPPLSSPLSLFSARLCPVTCAISPSASYETRRSDVGGVGVDRVGALGAGAQSGTEGLVLACLDC